MLKMVELNTLYKKLKSPQDLDYLCEIYNIDNNALNSILSELMRQGVKLGHTADNKLYVAKLNLLYLLVFFYYFFRYMFLFGNDN